MTTKIYEGAGLMLTELGKGYGETSRYALQLTCMQRDFVQLTPEGASEVGLALVRWASSRGVPLVWANLPASMHTDAEKAGLVQVKRTDQLEVALRDTFRPYSWEGLKKLQLIERVENLEAALEELTGKKQ